MLLTVRAAADILGCSAANVYALIESGQLVYVRIGKLKGYRIRQSDLDAFIEARRFQRLRQKRNAPRPRLKHIKL